MNPNDLDDLTLDMIMRRWPASIRVFLDRRMHCVGCPIAGFHTLGDAAVEHHMSPEDLESDIARIIAVRETTP